MADYVFYKGRWRGHSINDTIPAQTLTFLSRRQDTDTGIIYYYTGTEWKRSDLALVPDDILTLNELADVTNSSPNTNHILVYSSGNGTYINKIGVTRPFINSTFNGTTNSTRYIMLGSSAGSVTTESQVEFPVINTMTIKRVRIRTTTNGKDGSTTICVRKNNADVIGTSTTLTAGSTTAFDSGELSIAYAVNDKIAIKIDLSGSSNAGTLTTMILVDYESYVY